MRAMLSAALLITATGASCCVACSRNTPRDDATSSTPPAPSPSAFPASSFGPTVAGRFYPSDPGELRTMLQRYLDDGARAAPALEPERRLVGLISPHAGYSYSGAVAGQAWAQARRAKDIRTVVVLGPTHHRSRPYASTLDTDVYRTPVGDVPLALDLVARWVNESSGALRVDPSVFAPEHSVDVHIPFIRAALPSARVVPIVVPSLDAARLDALAGLLFTSLSKDPHAIVVASSDMSHFFDYATAQQVDEQIQREIVEGDVSTLVARHDERRGPCGVAPIVVLLLYAKRFSPTVQTTPLELINSGDTRDGDRSRVVGYLAAALSVGP